MIQTLSRELFAVADENGGKLKNRVVLFCDELGTMPAFDILPLFSAGRSRKLTLVPIIQSLAQLEKNYGKEGAEIIQDNVQDTIFGGFAPNSQTAEVLSKALGNRTVMSGSISRGKNDPSQSLQMIERPLMTPDELKSIPKGHFIVMKTGTHPMRTRLRLFLEWGITFEEPYVLPEKAARKVAYASKKELEAAIDAHVRDKRQFRQKPPTWSLLLQAIVRRMIKTMRSSRNRSTYARIQGRSVTMGYFEKIYRSDLSHRARAVYMYLKDRADSNGSCWPGINTIAVELGLSRSTVKRALADYAGKN